MGRKRRHEGGAIYGGRWDPDEPERRAIRTYMVSRLMQAQAALEVAHAACNRLRTTQSHGLVEYWEHVVAWLGMDVGRKSHGVDATTWAAASKRVQDEIVTGRDARQDQQTLPGME